MKKHIHTVLVPNIRESIKQRPVTHTRQNTEMEPLSKLQKKLFLNKTKNETDRTDVVRGRRSSNPFKQS